MIAPAISPVVPTRSTVRHERAILAMVLLSYFVILLDTSVVSTGLPSIAVTTWTSDDLAAMRLDPA